MKAFDQFAETARQEALEKQVALQKVLVQISKKLGARTRGALGERESLACQIGPKFKLCTRTAWLWDEL